MRKIWLLTTLLIAWLFLSGCNNSSNDKTNPDEWKSYSEAVQICEENDWEVTTDELWNNICLFNALDWCLLEKIQNWTCEYICEWDDCDVVEDFEDCEHYFDWCNRCTRNPDGTIVCTEKKCEIIEDHYCDESSYNEKYYQRLEEIEKSVRNSPDYEEFMKDLDSLPDPEEEELDVEEIEEAYSGDEQLD